MDIIPIIFLQKRKTINNFDPFESIFQLQFHKFQKKKKEWKIFKIYGKLFIKFIHIDTMIIVNIIRQFNLL